MQCRLVEVERLAAMGTVAATVAHEINNPLTYVLANLEVLAGRVQRSPGEAHALIADIREGAERVARIVADLKGFSRGDDGAVPTDVVSALERAIALAESELRKRATIVRDYRPVPCVLANAPRLGQVFVNLLVNAAHAIPEGGDHVVQIRVHAEGSSVVVDIEDDGVGIAPDTLRRIFDPFFTTKSSGTGLGLSISQQIVQRFGGCISVKSTPGTGSTFSVQLRAA
jgi:C4-dicarboxylate-specific signal transduction histidine kinase